MSSLLLSIFTYCIVFGCRVCEMVCRKTLDCARLMFALCKHRGCMMEIKLSTVRRQKETSRESLKDSGSCLELNLTLKNLNSQIYQKRFFLFIDSRVSFNSDAIFYLVLFYSFLLLPSRSVSACAWSVVITLQQWGKESRDCQHQK